MSETGFVAMGDMCQVKKQAYPHVENRLLSNG